MIDFTTVALTVISGTGLIGLILGIAFRDFTENFLASVLLSIQNPFKQGDLIEIISPASGFGTMGYVERLTWRVTVLIALDNKHLQITNSTVYKSIIHNYTTNPQRRDDFVVSLKPTSSISNAEEVALKVLLDHEAILKTPEPLILAESITPDLINLRIYYWIDDRQHYWLKIKSSIIRLVKEAFYLGGIDFSTKELEENKDVTEAPKTFSEMQSPADKSGKPKGISPNTHSSSDEENLLKPKDNTKKQGFLIRKTR